MKTVLALVVLIGCTPVFAQSNNDSSNKRDTTRLINAFRQGTVSGKARYFFMATDNAKGLSDYYAHAIGGKLEYETASFHRLKVGISTVFVYNAGSSNLVKKDAQTAQPNPYEVGLFALDDPNDKSTLGHLEELYVAYGSEKTNVTLGKQLINTPFINQQDSRMRPTEVEGIYGDVKLFQKEKLEGGWIRRISPRSTEHWYSVAESIGVNSQGLNPDGTPGNYKGNLRSAGVAFLGITYNPSAGVQLKAFHQYAKNLFTTSLLQGELTKTLGENRLLAAVQYIHQGVVHDGGNSDRTKTYFDPSNTVNIFGARAGISTNIWQVTLNYTRIGKGGRFTMPREWGTEPLFTYLSRERNEGMGDVDAVMLMTKAKLLNQRLKLEAGYGHYYVPPVENAALNKYGLPSYRHVKLLLDYGLSKKLNGFDISFLWIYKGLLGTSQPALKYVFNKVNMTSYNLVLNYSFKMHKQK